MKTLRTILAHKADPRAVLIVLATCATLATSGLAMAGDAEKADGKQIDRHGTCRTVHTDRGWPQAMVPTRHETEWNRGRQAFLAQDRAGTSVRQCGCRLPDPSVVSWTNCAMETVIERSGSGDSRKEKHVRKEVCRTCTPGTGYRAIMDKYNGQVMKRGNDDFLEGGTSASFTMGFRVGNYGAYNRGTVEMTCREGHLKIRGVSCMPRGGNI